MIALHASLWQLVAVWFAVGSVRLVTVILGAYTARRATPAVSPDAVARAIVAQIAAAQAASNDESESA